MEQTIETSSPVRVIEMKDAGGIDAGMGASAGKRQTANVPASCRNFRCMKKVSAEPQAASIAFLTAALASKRVESSVGSVEVSGDTNSGISVHPNTTASQPWSARVRITS